MHRTAPMTRETCRKIEPVDMRKRNGPASMPGCAWSNLAAPVLSAPLERLRESFGPGICCAPRGNVSAILCSRADLPCPVVRTGTKRSPPFSRDAASPFPSAVPISVDEQAFIFPRELPGLTRSTKRVREPCSSASWFSRRAKHRPDAEPVIGPRYAPSGTSCREVRSMSIHVIASEAKQSIRILVQRDGLLRRFAPGNDGMRGISLSPSLGGRRVDATAGAAGWGDGLSLTNSARVERSPHPVAHLASGDARRPSPSRARVSKLPHNSRAFENANELTRRVFSSKISVRVIGGSARWLQFSRSQSRQLTPIGVPSAFSRSIPAA